MTHLLNKIIKHNKDYYAFFEKPDSIKSIVRFFYLFVFVFYLFQDFARFEHIQPELLSLPFSFTFSQFSSIFSNQIHYLFLFLSAAAALMVDKKILRFLCFVLGSYLFYLRISFNCLYHFENVLIINLFLLCFVETSKDSVKNSNSLLFFTMQLNLILMYFFAALSKLRISGFSFITNHIPLEAILINDYWKFGNTLFSTALVQKLTALGLNNLVGTTLALVVLAIELISILFFFGSSFKKLIPFLLLLIQISFIGSLHLAGFSAVFISYVLFMRGSSLKNFLKAKE